MVVVARKTRRFRIRMVGWKAWLTDYLKHSSISGCTNYVTPGRHPVERGFWVIVHVGAIVCASLMILDLIREYAKKPIATTLETTDHPVQEVNFPGVAICNTNKISYAAARELATDIMISPYNANFSFDEVLDVIKYAGHLYLFEYEESERKIMDTIHRVLTGRFLDYSIRTIMRKLTPSCQRMLKFCSWNNRQEACEDIFYLRRTMDGYCCTFNYARSSENFESDASKKSRYFAAGDVLRSTVVGYRYGLTVLLDPEIHDHHYKMLPMNGFKVSVYPSTDYPDAPSGGLRGILVSPRTETYITLNAVTLHSTPEVYHVKKRNCRFQSELSQIFGGYYSYSDCIMFCRILEMIKKCRCVPFYYPHPIAAAKVSVCGFRHLSCLKKHKYTWWSVAPTDMDSEIFTEYDNDGTEIVPLPCQNCVPCCDDVSYSATTNWAPILDSQISMGGENRNIVDHSVVHVYFGDTGTVRLKKDVLFDWYELMSDYGGVCGFFLGVSWISLFEFVYFVTMRSWERVEDRPKRVNVHPRVTFVRASYPVSSNPLYWDELTTSKARY